MTVQFRRVLERLVNELPEGETVISCVPNATMVEAVKLLQTSNVGCVVIADGTQVKGIFSERDYMKKVALQPLDLRTETVDKYMTSNLSTVQPHETISNVMEMMKDNNFRHVIVTDNYGHIQRVVSQRDIMYYLIDSIKGLAD